MEDLAASLGISKKTIYNHFPSKEDMLEAALEEDIRVWVFRAEAIMVSDSMSLREKFDALLTHALEKIQERRAVFASEPWRPSRALPRRNNEIIRQGIASVLTGLISQGMEAGLMRREFEPKMVTFALLNMLQGVVAFSAEPDVPCSAEELIRGSIRMIKAGLLTDTGRVVLGV